MLGHTPVTIGVRPPRGSGERVQRRGQPVRVGDAVRRPRLAGPDLDPQVAVAQDGERGLVRRVVARVQHARAAAGPRVLPDDVAQPVHRLALGRLEHRDLDHVLAVHGVQPQVLRDRVRRRLRGDRVVGRGETRVEHGGAGLVLHPRALAAGDGGGEPRAQLGEPALLVAGELDRHRVDPVGLDVPGLRPVAADEVRRGRRLAAAREVLEVAPGDQGEPRRRALERPREPVDRGAGGRRHPRGRRVVDERGQRPVEVERDERRTGRAANARTAAASSSARSCCGGVGTVLTRRPSRRRGPARPPVPRRAGGTGAGRATASP
ncbi:hypothetical protein BJF88_03495 [Cellulosimicrobium sp. CUA-896]|nr:hypothetical protein BJF88_03495 [Cellulosimicrobium sp. CUA-896]